MLLQAMRKIQRKMDTNRHEKERDTDRLQWEINDNGRETCHYYNGQTCIDITLMEFSPHCVEICQSAIQILFLHSKLIHAKYRPFQREMIERLGIHFDDKNKINIGDFNDQELSLSLEYCLTLCKIGVQILRVNHVEEAYAFPIFRKVIQNLLQLKAKEKMTFRKSLFKLLTNSSYGYLLLRLDSRLKVQLIHGFSSMRRAIDSPRLDHFQLLDKDRMIGYFVPEKVKYSTLLPLGMFYFVLFIFNNIFL